MDVTELSSLQELACYEQQLAVLAQQVGWQNPFYEYWMLRPALEFLCTTEVRIILVRDGEQILGVFPVEAQSGYHRIPIQSYRLWRHRHCFLCTPLIRQGDEERVLAAFFGWLTSTRRQLFFEFGHVDGGEAFQRLLLQFATTQRVKVDFLQRYSRPILKIGEKPEDYLRGAMSSKHLKDFRKKKRKLAELGTIEFEKLKLSPHGDSPYGINEFLRLEASGWKGESKTAIALDANETSFLKAIVHSAAEQNRLQFYQLTLNGAAIAMRVGFSAGREGFSFKIAFDERFSKFSPGALLEIEHIDYALRSGELQSIDSCADPGHPMLSHLWKESREIGSLTMSTNLFFGRLLVSTMAHIRQIRGSRSSVPRSTHPLTDSV
jgi:hypothetical protein